MIEEKSHRTEPQFYDMWVLLSIAKILWGNNINQVSSTLKTFLYLCLPQKLVHISAFKDTIPKNKNAHLGHYLCLEKYI